MKKFKANVELQKAAFACGQCRGTACINASAFITDEEETNDEES